MTEVDVGSSYVIMFNSKLSLGLLAIPKPTIFPLALALLLEELPCLDLVDVRPLTQLPCGELAFPCLPVRLFPTTLPASSCSVSNRAELALFFPELIMLENANEIWQ